MNTILFSVVAGEKIFFKIERSVPFEKASEACQEENATLARPISRAEFDRFRNFGNYSSNFYVWIAMTKVKPFIRYTRSQFICTSPFTQAERWKYLEWTDNSTDTSVDFPSGIRFWAYNCREYCFRLNLASRSEVYIDDVSCSTKILYPVLCEGISEFVSEFVNHLMVKTVSCRVAEAICQCFKYSDF